MKLILKQAALTFVSFAALYLIVLALSFIVLPSPSKDGVLDGQTAGDSLYMTTPKYVFLGRSVLAAPDRKVILIGASNTGNGLRPNIMRSLVPCAKIHNLAVGGANIYEVGQIIDLVHEVQSADDRRSDTFVIGVSYGMFVDSDVRYADADRHRGETDIDIERYRYGFARRTSNGAVSVVSPKWLDTGVTLIRPILLLEKMARDIRTSVEKSMGHSRDRTETEREAAVMTDKQKQDALDYWRQQMGNGESISFGQVAELKRIVDRLLNSGERVVLVDLPIPAWHRNASPYYAGYREALQALVPSFEDRPGFEFLSMGDLDGDLDYSDEVHAKPHLAVVWSERLAHKLRPLVCPKVAEPQTTSLQRDATPGELPGRHVNK
ncbi:hypothetical protein Q2941_15440 [Bradyrhizobium sp. UFLA05-153]